MKKSAFFVTAVMTAVAAQAQSYTFPTDALERGYYDRPYLRYEAQPGMCSPDGGTFITAEPYSQDQLASEASDLQALTLNNKGESVAWTLDADANALTIRFSIPDNATGTGTQQNLALYDGDTKITDVTLDSYWAWQYTVKANVSEKYPDNTPSADKFARMRFDEADVLLPVTVKAGHTLRLVKDNDSADPMTIDFVEAEMAAAPLTFDEIEATDKVEYTGDGSNLPVFVTNNGGKTIYIGPGTYNVPSFIEIKNDGTRIVGAGLWHTVLNFTASPTNRRTYNRRGIHSSSNNCGVSGLTMNTLNNQRYFENNPSFQAGKGFEGSWGTNSVIENVRVSHFECGAWIADYNGNASRNLRVTDCRFRNNYADGINLCSGTQGAVVSHCSFRNNGDDDQAVWSTGNWSQNNEYAYNTAENNWRASSLGFFGGQGNKAHHIAIFDAMECGARINGTFQGTGFGDEESEFSDISIYRAGCTSQTTGIQGDFWGNANPALWVMGGYFYAVKNVTVRNIDLYNSRFEGVRIQSNSSRAVDNLTLENIHVDGVSADGRAFNFYPGLRGSGIGSGLTYTNCTAEAPISTIPATFDFTLDTAIDAPTLPRPDVTATATGIMARGLTEGTALDIHSVTGVKVATLTTQSPEATTGAGIYIVSAPGHAPAKLRVP